jgi:alkyl hydroperoxide reductase subunit AhpC
MKDLKVGCTQPKTGVAGGEQANTPEASSKPAKPEEETMSTHFIIDPGGVVQAVGILAPPVGRNVNELIRQVQAFQHVRETGGAEATPSGWPPGKTTLKPGPDLVGKVWEAYEVDEAF